jgi:hypothetical protein
VGAAVKSYSSDSPADVVHGLQQESECDLQPPNKLPKKENKEDLICGFHLCFGAIDAGHPEFCQSLGSGHSQIFCGPGTAFKIPMRRSLSLFECGRMKIEIM